MIFVRWVSGRLPIPGGPLRPPAAWCRLRHWTGAGVRPCLHATLLIGLRRAGLLDLDDCSADGSHVPAL